MFKKRVRKYIPPETFIPLPARVLAIIQLCLAFTILLWHLSQPFMGDLFTIKSKMLVYQHVMGKKIESHAHRFAQMEDGTKQKILAEYDQLQRQLDRSFWLKLSDSIYLLWYKIPRFELIWILLSIIIPILLLKRVEGSISAMWLLPIAVLLFAVDNRLNAIDRPISEEERLFPSEEEIVTEYLLEPLKPNIFEQEKQLREGWEQYLISIWAPKSEAIDFKKQVEDGDFAFNIERIQRIQKDMKNKTAQKKQLPLFLLGIFLFWNLSFVLITKKTLPNKHLAKASPC